MIIEQNAIRFENLPSDTNCSWESHHCILWKDQLIFNLYIFLIFYILLLLC